jgi:hypothetical protein
LTKAEAAARLWAAQRLAARECGSGGSHSGGRGHFAEVDKICHPLVRAGEAAWLLRATNHFDIHYLKTLDVGSIPREAERA